jgi:hypothetical protein
MKWIPIILAASSFLLLSIPSAEGAGDPDVSILIDPVYDAEDRNEWGPSLGGEEILPEWGEPIALKALPKTSFEVAVFYIWNITNLETGDSWIYQGNDQTIMFIPSTRSYDTPTSEKFLVALYVHYVRSDEIAATAYMQFYVWPDDDNDNDGMPDIRERYYWKDGIIHHHPEYDEDGDGYTNVQEIGFDIPLAYSERRIPYVPPIGHFDPTDPSSPPTGDPPLFINKTPPKGPVMSRLAIYFLMGGIISPAIAAVIFDIIYIKYFYLEPSRERIPSLLEKSREYRPLPLLHVLKDGSVG